MMRPTKRPTKSLKSTPHFLIISTKQRGVKILEAVEILLPEFIKYTINRLPYYYPTMLPSDLLAKEVKTGEINSKLWIPLEDLYEGWDPCGQVGQEVYGAGMAFGVVPRHYFKIPETTLIVFCNYPIKNSKVSKKSMKFTTLGSIDFTCLVKIFSDEELPEITMKSKSATIEAVHTTKKEIDYMLMEILKLVSIGNK